MCGIAVTVENNRVTNIAPDREHVATRGYSCVKGVHFDQVQHSPDRILHPMKRIGDRWERITWDQALAEIGARVRALVQQHGPQTVGYYGGASCGVNLIAPLFRGAFFAAIGTRSMYGNSSLDCANKFRVCQDMYGHCFRLPYPDVDHSRFLLFLGANPAVSGGGLFHLPNPVQRLRAVVRRGGRVVFVNPRRTETARAGEHIFIRPDTDVFFLAAFLREMIARGDVDLPRVERYMTGFEVLRDVVALWTPERAAAVTGISAATLRDLVTGFAAAEGAALHMSTGVNQGRHGTVCAWLLECINAVSGNLDRRGGSLIGQGIFDWPAEGKRSGQPVCAVERRDGMPTIVGNYPTSLLADDILRSDGNRLTAVIVEAGNPLLVAPNPGGRLTEAFRRLDLVVSIDLFRNETANLAHYILPATTFLERADLPYAMHSLLGDTPVRYISYTDAVVDAPPDVRPEWWIYTRLAHAAGLTLFGSRLRHWAVQLNARLALSRWGRMFAATPERLISAMLRRSGVGSRREHLRKWPHGRLLDENQPGTFLGTPRVLTDDGKVHLAPAEIVAEARRLEQSYAHEVRDRDRLKLITKRELRSLNSWMHNNPRLVSDKTNYLYVHPDDAAQRAIRDGDVVEVTSAFDSLQVPVRVTDEMMPGTVALPYGWGHAEADGLRVAQQHPGVNSNLLAGDGPANVDPLSGMAHLSGIVVDVRAVEPA
jgi:anaerobic selenocysteine-containing dehydrogenase